MIYFGETEVCAPLYDPQGQIARLKEAVRTYPERLKARIVRGSLWGAEFSLLHARQFAERADVYNAVGCLTRVAQYLTQALFALNEPRKRPPLKAGNLSRPTPSTDVRTWDDDYPGRPHLRNLGK